MTKTFQIQVLSKHFFFVFFKLFIFKSLKILPNCPVIISLHSVGYLVYVILGNKETVGCSLVNMSNSACHQRILEYDAVEPRDEAPSQMWWLSCTNHHRPCYLHFEISSPVTLHFDKWNTLED